MTKAEKPTEPEEPTAEQLPAAPEFPKMLYHLKDSKLGALVYQVVQNAEEEKALGREWGPHTALKLNAD
jgi:hypothetical protein